MKKGEFVQHENPNQVVWSLYLEHQLVLHVYFSDYWSLGSQLTPPSFNFEVETDDAHDVFNIETVHVTFFFLRDSDLTRADLILSAMENRCCFGFRWLGADAATWFSFLSWSII